MSLSVTDFTIDNASGQAVRLDIQACFKALQGQSAESSDLAGTQCVAGMTFLNTSTNILKIRNSANNGFTDIGNINTANLGLLPVAGGTMTGTLNFGSSATSIKETSSNNNLAFLTNSTARWQINSAGSLFSLPNTNKESNTGINFLTDAGVGFFNNGGKFETLSLVKDGPTFGTVLYLNRKGSGDGNHIEFVKDDVIHGKIGNVGNNFYIDSSQDELILRKQGTDQWAVNSNGGFQWKQDLCRNKYTFNDPTYGALSADASGIDVNSGVLRFAGLTSRRGTASNAATSNPYNFFWDDYSTSTDHLESYIDGQFVGDVSLVTSDYRIKRNVNLQTESGINKVKNLKPVTYQFKEYGKIFKDKEEIREGFIAHEVQEVIPSAVNREKDVENSLQTLNLDAIVSVLTKALQEAVAKIETLEAKVAALEAK